MVNKLKLEPDEEIFAKITSFVAKTETANRNSI
jgi:hypothetical protein